VGGKKSSHPDDVVDKRAACEQRHPNPNTITRFVNTSASTIQGNTAYSPTTKTASENGHRRRHRRRAQQRVERGDGDSGVARGVHPQRGCEPIRVALPCRRHTGCFP